MFAIAHRPLSCQNLETSFVNLPVKVTFPQNPLRARTAALQLAVGLWCAAAWTPALRAQDVAEDLNAARQALEKNEAHRAIGILEQALKRDEGTAEEAAHSRLMLAQVLLREGRAERVESVLRGMERNPGAALCLAQVSLQSERWSSAVERFELARALGNDPAVCALGRAKAFQQIERTVDAIEELRALETQGIGGNAVRLGLVGLLLDRGAVAEAQTLLERVTQPSTAEAQYCQLLQARLVLVAGREAEAEAGFDAVLGAGVPVPSEVLLGAVLGRAEAVERRHSPDIAARGLLQFLQNGRELPGAEPLFRRLSALLSESQAPAEAEFRAFTRKGSPAYRAMAQFYLAQFYFQVGKPAKAVEALRTFGEEFPAHRLQGDALLQRAEQALDAGDTNESVRLLKEAQKHADEPRLQRLIQMRSAFVSFRLKAFDRALAEFTKAAERWPELHIEAGYNAGLSAVRAGNYKRALHELECLKADPESGMLAAELELEIALHRASTGQSQSDEALQAFIRSHPQHPRIGDARVALAELYSIEADRPQIGVGLGNSRVLREHAASLLRTVANDPQSSQAAVQAKALAIFLADASKERNEDEVLQQGEAFIRDYPGSSLASQMRMKLGEVYFRRKDYANAEAHFATLAAQQPEAGLTETALFLAGQCASSLLNPGSVDRALGYWDKVASANGPLRWKARYQQAAVKSRLGEEAEGAILFDLILNAGEGVDADLRAAARCSKADALLSLAKRSGAALEDALQEYRKLAGSGAPPVWRNQALYKVGKALETRQPDEALKAFYAVLDAPGSTEVGEFFWLHKAGFDAARLLENQSAWRDAVALYERLSSLGGPRGEEARKRALQLRLEHFLWE